MCQGGQTANTILIHRVTSADAGGAGQHSPQSVGSGAGVCGSALDAGHVVYTCPCLSACGDVVRGVYLAVQISAGCAVCMAGKFLSCSDLVAYLFPRCAVRAADRQLLSSVVSQLRFTLWQLVTYSLRLPSVPSVIYAATCQVPSSLALLTPVGMLRCAVLRPAVRPIRDTLPCGCQTTARMLHMF